jgi:hypothetical protein
VRRSRSLGVAEMLTAVPLFWPDDPTVRRGTLAWASAERRIADTLRACQRWDLTGRTISRRRSS